MSAPPPPSDPNLPGGESTPPPHGGPVPPPPGGQGPPGQPPYAGPPASGDSGGGGSKKGLFIGLGVGAVVLIAAVAVTLALVLGGGGGATSSVRTLIDSFADQECEVIDDVVHDDFSSANFFISTAECEEQVEFLEGLGDEQPFDADLEIRELDEIDDPESLSVDEDADNDQVIVRADMKIDVTADGELDSCGEVIAEFLVENVDGDWLVKQENFVEQNELDLDEC